MVYEKPLIAAEWEKDAHPDVLPALAAAAVGAFLAGLVVGMFFNQ